MITEKQLIDNLNRYMLLLPLQPETQSWWSIRKTLMDSLSIEEFVGLYTYKSAEEWISYKFKDNSYAIKSFHVGILNKYGAATYKDLHENAVNDSYRAIAINYGYYSGIEDINKLIMSSDSDAKILAASRCSLSLLEHLKNDSDFKVRMVVYDRLNKSDYLDEMLSDKHYKIRLAAAQLAPINYPKFKDLVKEPAFRVALEVAKKIDIKYIPFFLTNRNVKRPLISNIINERMTLAGDKENVTG